MCVCVLAARASHGESRHGLLMTWCSRHGWHALGLFVRAFCHAYDLLSSICNVVPSRARPAALLESGGSL